MEMHSHRCKACGLIWHHSCEMRGSPDAHQCFRCGAKGQWERFQAQTEPVPAMAVPYKKSTVEHILDATMVVLCVSLVVVMGTMVYRALKDVRVGVISS